MIARLSKKFSSTKSSDFFWTDVNECVVKAQYAVRGVVPSTANLMKDELATNPNSSNLFKPRIPFQGNHLLQHRQPARIPPKANHIQPVSPGLHAEPQPQLIARHQPRCCQKSLILLEGDHQCRVLQPLAWHPPRPQKHCQIPCN